MAFENTNNNTATTVNAVNIPEYTAAKVRRAEGRIRCYQDIEEIIKEIVATAGNAQHSAESVIEGIEGVLPAIKKQIASEQKILLTWSNNLIEIQDVIINQKDPAEDYGSTLASLRRAYVVGQECAHYLTRIDKWCDVLLTLIDMDEKLAEADANKLRRALRRADLSMDKCWDTKKASDSLVTAIKQLIEPVASEEEKAFAAKIGGGIKSNVA